MLAEVTPTVELVLPYRFSWRNYQAEAWQALRAGCKRAAFVWHRRAGKDMTAMNWTIREAVLGRPGTYYYFFPTYNQGRKILWDGYDAQGVRFMHRFPGFEQPGTSLVRSTNETEMQVKIARPDGMESVFQIIGTDKCDHVVGTNAIGNVFSEYSLQNPKAWNLIRPIVAENNGWAIFPYTPRGKNWGFDLYKAACADSSWFVSLKTVDDTFRDAEGEPRFGERVVSAEAIEAERRAGMPEELIQQEFYCSFEGSLVGAYYADQIKQMRDEKRIKAVRYEPIIPVVTTWDLGVDDETAIVFTQTVDPWVYWIDCYKASGHGLEHYKNLLGTKPYAYGDHFGPHDIKVRDWSTGNTRLQHAAQMGLHFQVVPKLSVADGIQALRRLLPKSIIDEENCAPLIDALSAYRREFDEATQTFRAQPVHDWSSHLADAARYRAVAYHETPREESSDWAETEWSIFGAKRSAYDSGWNPFDA